MRFREFASALVWGLATGTAAYFVSLPGAAMAAALGGTLGYLVGCGLARTRLRLASGLVLALLAYLSFKLAGGALTGMYSLASALGAGRSFLLGQCMEWGGQAFVLSGLLRFLSGRQSALISAEMLTVTLLLASPLAAHRDGFISRPYFLADPIWSANLEPGPVLFGLGALAAGLLVILQHGRRTRRASVLDLLLLFALITGLYAFLPERQVLDFDVRDPFAGWGKKPGPGKPEDARKKDKENRGTKDRDKESQGGGSSQKEEMDMEKSNDSQQNPKPIAIVLLKDDYTPPVGFYYFRQSAFSQYNGKRLVTDTTGKVDQDLLTGFPVQPVKIPSTVSENSIFHRKLGTRVAMMTSHSKPFTMVDGISAEPVENPNPGQFVRAYECESLVFTANFEQLFPLKAGDRRWTPEMLKHYLQGPDDPRYAKLAEQCVAQLPEQYRQSDFARAVSVKLYMDKTMTYSTKVSYEGISDITGTYLFERKKGYCVHQAHAAVHLFRALGIPSRVATGYATDARNRGNGSAILLRSAEAHAWPEVYLENAGWVPLDISPEKHEGGDLEQPDPNLQRMLGEMARKGDKRPEAEDKEFKKISLQAIIRALALFVVNSLKWALILGLTGSYLYKFFRRFEPLWASPKRLPIAALRSGLDQLAEVGVVRHFGEGRVGFARRSRMEALEPLTYHHLGAVMGNQQPSAKELLKLREQLHRQIAAAFPWWKRLLGFLNPLSWWSSR